MTKQELVTRMQEGQAWVPGRRVKIDFGGDQGAIMLDGAAQQVSEDMARRTRRSWSAGTTGSNSPRVSSTE